MNGTQDTIESIDIYGQTYQVPRANLSWRPSAYGIVVKDDNILLVTHNGKYHLPGGGLDLGEDPADAVLREVKEETGYTVSEPKFIDLLSSIFTFRNPATKQLQHYHSLLLYYTCQLTARKQQSVELDEFEKLYGHGFDWVPLAKLRTTKPGSSVDWRPVVTKALHSAQSS